jgi:glycosyltransferase involved in cell wall biosynthesis
MSVGRDHEDAKPPGQAIRSLTPNVSVRHRYRLAIWITHPIQYQAPLFRKLAQHPQIDLTVYYGSDQGSVNRIDPEFGVSFQWDIPLLEGYRFKFLRNYSWKTAPTGFWWPMNAGIVRELIRQHYDAVLIHGYALATSWLAYFGAWLSHTPVLFRGETRLREQPAWKRAVKKVGLRPLFRGTAACLAIGRRSTEFYLAHGVPRSKVFLTPYCVDNDYFTFQGECWRLRRAETRRELDLPEDVPVVLYSGKLTPGKRPMDLVSALTHLSGKVGALFVGDGSLGATLEAEVRRCGMPYVRFVGFQNQSALPRYYSAADMFALPSASEGFGLVVNEAMCMGLPVLTTPAVAAAADLVREGENGFLFPVGDLETLARRIGQLAADPGLRLEMGKRSREIIAGWNYDACVEGVVSALRHVAA